METAVQRGTPAVQRVDVYNPKTCYVFANTATEMPFW